MEGLKVTGDLLVQTFGNHSCRSPLEVIMGQVIICAREQAGLSPLK